MSDNEMRIAIAEHLGWDASEDVLTGSGMVQHPDGGRVPRNLIPNYPEDLNACHEMEKALTPDQIDEYYLRLAHRDHPKNPMRATARQRAEAFLRCVGKWKE